MNKKVTAIGLIILITISLMGCSNTKSANTPSSKVVSSSKEISKPKANDIVASSTLEPLVKDAENQAAELGIILKSNGITFHTNTENNEVRLNSYEKFIDGNKIFVEFTKKPIGKGGRYIFSIASTQLLNEDFNFKDYEYLKELIKFGTGNKSYDFDNLTAELNKLLIKARAQEQGESAPSTKTVFKDGVTENVRVFVEDGKKNMTYVLSQDLDTATNTADITTPGKTTIKNDLTGEITVVDNPTDNATDSKVVPKSAADQTAVYLIDNSNTTPKTYYRDSQKKAVKLTALLKTNGIESETQFIGSQVNLTCKPKMIGNDAVSVSFNKVITNNGGMFDYGVYITQPLEGDFDFTNYEYLKEFIIFGTEDNNFDFNKLTSELNTMLAKAKTLRDGEVIQPLKTSIKNNLEEKVCVSIENGKKTMYYELDQQLLPWN